MNDHMMHPEDIYLMEGMNGLKRVTEMFEDLFFMQHNVRIKVDGSPSFCIGYDDDRFFVATKSLFNKVPKLYYSLEELEELNPEPLREKMRCVFNHFKGCRFDGIYQGDLLFWDKKTKLTIRPNVLNYSIDLAELEGKTLGCAIHTRYDGLNTLDHAEYCFDINRLNIPNSVFVYDTTVKETKFDTTIYKTLQVLNVVSTRVYDNTVHHIESMDDRKIFQQFFNHCIREDIDIIGSHDIVTLLVDFAINYYQNKVDSYKTYEKKIEYIAKCKKCIFDLSKKASYIIEIYREIFLLKNDFIYGLNKYNQEEICVNMKWHSFPDEQIKTKHEGYVVDLDGEAVKLVDREEFSYYNFSDKYIKGWEK